MRKNSPKKLLTGKKKIAFSDCFSLQMTAQEVRLCGLLLREHFGEVVEKVGTHLLRGGAQNLRTIINETGISLDLVLLLHLLFLGCYCLYFTPWKRYYYT